jgi:hypothetical protein
VTRRIELHVDELVLDGLSAADGRRIAAALEQELGRRLAGSDLRVDGDRSVETLGVGVVDVGSGSPADAIGARIASSLLAKVAQ